MKFILKILACFSLILISKITQQDETATSGTAMETDKGKSSFANYYPQAPDTQQSEQDVAKEAAVIY